MKSCPRHMNLFSPRNQSIFLNGTDEQIPRIGLQTHCLYRMYTTLRYCRYHFSRCFQSRVSNVIQSPSWIRTLERLPENQRRRRRRGVHVVPQRLMPRQAVQVDRLRQKSTADCGAPWTHRREFLEGAVVRVRPAVFAPVPVSRSDALAVHVAMLLEPGCHPTSAVTADGDQHTHQQCAYMSPDYGPR